MKIFLVVCVSVLLLINDHWTFGKTWFHIQHTQSTCLFLVLFIPTNTNTDPPKS